MGSVTLTGEGDVAGVGDQVAVGDGVPGALKLDTGRLGRDGRGLGGRHRHRGGGVDVRVVPSPFAVACRSLATVVRSACVMVYVAVHVRRACVVL